MNPLRALAAWLGGWSRVVLLVVVVIGVAIGLYWQSQRHPPVPPNATQVVSSINVDVRQTTFRYPGSPDEVRTFYKEQLPSRGWRYCGTQETPKCTNLTSLIGGIGEQTDVYRRADDQNFQGTTIEIRPIPTDNGQTFVTMFETRGS